MLLLHGFTGSGRSWGTETLDRLAVGGVSVNAYDLPGHGARRGERDPNAFTLAALLDEVREAVDAPSPVIGYSMGGRLALHFAERFPDCVTQLVLESSSPGLETDAERDERRALDDQLAERLLSAPLSAFVDDWEALPLFSSQSQLPQAQRDQLRAGRLDNDPASLAAALRGLGTGTLPSLWPRLPTLTTRTLILAGALDAKFVTVGERMARAMPNAHMVVVEGAGHAVHLERPGAWCDAVTGFLAE